MESRVQKTLENHKKGYNCAQAVACAYCDLVGMTSRAHFGRRRPLGLAWAACRPPAARYPAQ